MRKLEKLWNLLGIRQIVYWLSPISKSCAEYNSMNIKFELHNNPIVDNAFYNEWKFFATIFICRNQTIETLLNFNKNQFIAYWI